MIQRMTTESFVTIAIKKISEIQNSVVIAVRNELSQRYVLNVIRSTHMMRYFAINAEIN